VTRQRLPNSGDDHSSGCDTDPDNRSPNLHTRQTSGIPAILAAIECDEAAVNGNVNHTSELGLFWRQNPAKSLSDWTIEVIPNGLKTAQKYHVHREILAVGPKRSEYFARLFVSQKPKPSNKSVLELGLNEARVFYLLLDHMYSSTDTRPTLDMGTACALYSLADQLEVPSLLLSISDFCTTETSDEDIIDLLKVGESFRDKMLLRTTLHRCAEGLNSMEITTARRIKPALFVEILQRSKTLPKKYKCSSSRLSQLVAATMEGHPSSLKLEIFRRLTDKEYLPYIEGTAAVKLLAFEQELASQQSHRAIRADATLHERCLYSITNSWDRVKQKLQEDSMLASRMKAVSSTMLYEILMRTHTSS
jgi:hypothetical protein